MQGISLLRAMTFTNLKSVPSNRLRLEHNIWGQRIHTLQTGFHNVVTKCGRHLKILGARRARLSIYHYDDPLILGATIIMKYLHVFNTCSYTICQFALHIACTIVTICVCVCVCLDEPFYTVYSRI